MTLRGLNQILAFYGHPAANRASSSLRFDLAGVTDLELAPGSLGGVLGWWSWFNLPCNVLAEVVVDFARALVPGGQVLLGTHVGEQDVPRRQAGRPTSAGLRRCAGGLDDTSVAAGAAGRRARGRQTRDGRGDAASRP
jgi:hypothetical protein